MLLRYRTGDFKFAVSQVPYALLHYSTDDSQFALWNLYYAALLCRSVIFLEQENVQIFSLSLFINDLRHFFHSSGVAAKY